MPGGCLERGSPPDKKVSVHFAGKHSVNRFLQFIAGYGILLQLRIILLHKFAGLIIFLC
jgi:hypothetical protein